jgi:flagellar biosynthesis protein FlhF
VKLRTYKAFTQDHALQAARADLGSTVRVVQTRTVKRKGLLGFWHRRIVEVTVELPQAEAASSAGLQAAAIYAPQKPAADSSVSESAPQPLDMEFERAKTRRLAQALAIKLEREREVRRNNERNERAVESTARLQEALNQTVEAGAATPDDGLGARVNRAPASDCARRFVVEQHGSEQRVREREELFGSKTGEGAEVTTKGPANQSSQPPSHPSQGVDQVRAVVAAAIDDSFDGPLSAGQRVNPEALREVYTRLIEQEVSEEIAETILIEIAEELGDNVEDVARVSRSARRRVSELLPIDDHPLDIEEARRQGRPHVVALIGPTGVGKTTTIAKLAASCRFREGLSVGLVTTDSFRMAAVDQLGRYAEILQVALEVVIEPEDMIPALKRLAQCDVILVDTAGRSRRDSERLEELGAFLAQASPDETHLVLSTTSGQRTMLRDADAFSQLGADRIVLTKLDEADGFGVVLNVIRKLDTRISFVTTGQEVPDDIEQGGADRIARLLLGHDAVTAEVEVKSSGTSNATSTLTPDCERVG